MSLPPFPLLVTVNQCLPILTKSIYLIYGQEEKVLIGQKVQMQQLHGFVILSPGRILIFWQFTKLCSQSTIHWPSVKFKGFGKVDENSSVAQFRASIVKRCDVLI